MIKHCTKYWDGGHDGGFCMVDDCGCHKSRILKFKKEMDFITHTNKAIEELDRCFDPNHSEAGERHFHVTEGEIRQFAEDIAVAAMSENAVCWETVDGEAICGQNLDCHLHRKYNIDELINKAKATEKLGAFQEKQRLLAYFQDCDAFDKFTVKEIIGIINPQN